MSPLRWNLWQAVLGAIVPVVFLMPVESASAQPASPTVDLKTVNYQELGKAIRECKGQVIVVDIWASYCRPCKKAFPDLVRLHQKYQKEGLACVSVSVDAMKDKEAALQFLRSQNATFANYLLAEEPQVWQDRWDINGPPAVFVFNRKNERAGRFDHNDPDKDYTNEHEAIEKLVRELLREAP